MLSGRQNPGCLDEMDGRNSRVLSYKTRHNLTWMLQNDEFDSFFSFVSFVSFVMKHRQPNRHCPWRKAKNWPLKRCEVWGHRWLRAALVRVRCPQINLSGRNGKSHRWNAGYAKFIQIHPKSKFGKTSWWIFWWVFLPWKRKSKLRVKPQAKLRGFVLGFRCGPAGLCKDHPRRRAKAQFTIWDARWWKCLYNSINNIDR